MPWFFTDFSTKVILGFPAWAIYSLSTSVVYAIIIAFLLEKYWSVSASEDENESKGGSR